MDIDEQLDGLRRDLSALRRAQATLAGEYARLVTRIQHLEKSLEATRPPKPRTRRTKEEST